MRVPDGVMNNSARRGPGERSPKKECRREDRYQMPDA